MSEQGEIDWHWLSHEAQNAVFGIEEAEDALVEYKRSGAGEKPGDYDTIKRVGYDEVRAELKGAKQRLYDVGLTPEVAAETVLAIFGAVPLTHERHHALLLEYVRRLSDAAARGAAERTSVDEATAQRAA